MTQESSPPHHARSVTRRIRMRKEDSAFVYCILEASFGITSYTTIDVVPGAAHRDVELLIPFHFQTEVEEMIQRLGDLVYELEITSG